MDKPDLVTTDPPPAWRTVLAIAVALLGGITAMVFSPLGSRFGVGKTPSNADTMAILLCSLVGIALAASLFWRQRYPVAITLAHAVAAQIVPIGVVGTMLATGSLLGRRRDRTALISAGAASVSMVVVIVRDSLASPRPASFLKYLLGPTDYSAPVDSLPVEFTVIAILVTLGLSIGPGLLVRARREAASARVTASEHMAQTEQLGDEVARRQEREQIAREVHDSLGHRLSLLNIHAGALEANAAGNPELEESARLVRESAAAALTDLRSLLTMLREPSQPQPDLPLTSLADVVNEAFGAGAPLASSIFIEDADRADPALSRAVYRIVQELLTNARKHAPGAPTRLLVTGSPAAGITIDCSNALTAPIPPRSGDSRGLAGIHERAELLGGQVTAGTIDDGHGFRVTVTLPWR